MFIIFALLCERLFQGIFFGNNFSLLYIFIWEISESGDMHMWRNKSQMGELAQMAAQSTSDCKIPSSNPAGSNENSNQQKDYSEVPP